MPLKKLYLTGKKPSVVPQIEAAAADSLILDGRGWNNKDRKHGPGPPGTHLTMVQGPIVAVNHAAEPPSGTAFRTLSWPVQRPRPARIISRSSSATPSAPLSL